MTYFKYFGDSGLLARRQFHKPPSHGIYYGPVSEAAVFFFLGKKGSNKSAWVVKHYGRSKKHDFQRRPAKMGILQTTFLLWGIGLLRNKFASKIGNLGS